MRMIDADKMREEVLHGYANEEIYTANDILSLIDEQPTIDAVEVVRCEDCKYWNECGFGMHDDQCHCSRIDYWTNADFFCAACVRKEDNEDIVFGYDNISDDDDYDDWFCADGERKDGERREDESCFNEHSTDMGASD